MDSINKKRPLRGGSANTVDCIGQAAVAIRRFRGGSQHAALFLRDDANELKLLHFAFHNDLRLEGPSGEYGWVDFWDIDDVNMGIFVDWCFLVASENKEFIPYSILYDGVRHFDESGRIVSGPPGHGLTCATFVLDLMLCQGWHVLDLDSWIYREDDETWFKETILGGLQHPSYGVPYQHILAQSQAAKSFLRYRPDELVGGVSVYNMSPVSMSAAVDRAREIVVEMNHLGLP